MLEGALMVNSHWKNHITVRRIAYSKPRKELVKLLGPKNQWLPVLIIDPDTTLTNPVDITRYLALEYGGAKPHP
jgi:glutathione S-transferase